MAGISDVDGLMAKIKKKFDDVITNSLIDSCRGLLLDAEVNANYHNLTGNTLTSLTCGVYRMGKLKYSVNIMKEDLGLEAPTNRKLSRTDVFAEFTDYDTGKELRLYARHMAKFEPTDKKFGFQTAKRFLWEYKPEIKDCIVLTTGTEYSEYLQGVRKLNVLTETFMTSPEILKASFINNLRKG